MSFSEAVKSCFTNYFNFSSRASRSEYWFFTLFMILGSVILSILDVGMGTFDPESGIGTLSAVFSIVVLIPSLSVTVRRLHDVNRSGWWLLIYLTIIGILLILYWMVMPSDEGENSYGANPNQNSSK